MVPVFRRLYDQLAEPKYVIACGSCAISGGPFRNSYHVAKGIEDIVPVDVFVPGCPPRPEAMIYGIMQLSRKIKVERFFGGVNRKENSKNFSPSTPWRASKINPRSLISVMANFIQKIQTLFPAATVEGDATPLVTIPEEQWHDMALALRDDADLKFDYCVTVVGMDWTENLGAIYYLMSTKTNDIVGVKVIAKGDREKPWIHSVEDVWHVAGLYEREVYDFFGIIFVGHSDMRRLFLNLDWVGYPMRKDYDANPEINPVSIENERQTDFTDVYSLDDKGQLVKGQRRIFEKDDFVVNIGPQHPATHGVLRFRTAVNGEEIQKIDIYLGYIHRGIEKLCESLSYPQTLHFMDRMDYFSAHNYHHALCMIIEKAAGIEISRRAQVIRVMMDELSRIASHCLFIGTYCMDLGATTMLFYTLRVREQILDIMEKTCGARMTFNYDCIGGVMQDLAPDFVDDVKALLAVLPRISRNTTKSLPATLSPRTVWKALACFRVRMLSLTA